MAGLRPNSDMLVSAACVFPGSTELLGAEVLSSSWGTYKPPSKPVVISEILASNTQSKWRQKPT